jgi:hypothetical protein
MVSQEGVKLEPALTLRSLRAYHPRSFGPGQPVQKKTKRPEGHRARNARVSRSGARFVFNELAQVLLTRSRAKPKSSNADG